MSPSTAIEGYLRCGLTNEEKDLLNKHDYDNPANYTHVRSTPAIARLTRSRNEGYSIYVKGNCVVRDNDVVHLLQENIVSNQKLNIEEWRSAFEALGWQVIEGWPRTSYGLLDSEEAEKQRIDKVLHLQFIKMQHHDHILVHLPMKAMGGGWQSKSVSITSSGRADIHAARLIEEIEKYEHRLPQSTPSMKRFLSMRLDREITEICKRHDLDMTGLCEYENRGDIQVLAHITLHDERLQAAKNLFAIPYTEKLLTKDLIEFDRIDMERLEKALKTEKRRRKTNAGRNATQMVTNHHKAGSLSKHKHGKKEYIRGSDSLTTIKHVVKDGKFDLEMTFNSANRKISATRSQCRIKGLEIPATVAQKAIGKPLSKIISHPLLAGNIIITSIQHEKDGALIRYRQPLYQVGKDDMVGAQIKSGKG